MLPLIPPSPEETRQATARIPQLKATARRRRRLRHLALGATGGLTVLAVIALKLLLPHTGGDTVSVVSPSGSAAFPPEIAAVHRAHLGAGGTFIATLEGPSQAPTLVVADIHNGTVLAVIHELPWNGMNVHGTALDSHGDIWVTLNRGPTCSSNIAGCGPLPGSCASTVLTINSQSGKVTTVLRGGDDELISNAVPSPNGQLLAYLHSGCATSYFDNSITVKELASAASWDIGAGLARCHVLAHPIWTAASDHLVATYGAAAAPPYAGQQGTCSVPQPSVMAIIPAGNPTPQLPDTTVTATAQPGCEITVAVPTATGYAAIERCGTESYLNGPDRLLRYSPTPQIQSTLNLGDCQDGADLAVDASGQDLLASSYLFCNTGTEQPFTQMQGIAGDAQHTILTITGGNLAVNNISF